MHSGVQRSIGVELNPDFLIADLAGEIRNGFFSLYPEKACIDCWYHVSTNIEKRLKREVHDETDFNRIKYDVHKLQLSQSQEVFQYAAELFIKKWKPQYSEFVKYFERQYVEQHNQWFEGVAYGVPSTNVAQESTHAKIKQTFTGNRRTSMAEMVRMCSDIVRNWSMDLKNIKPFATKPEISDQEMIDAYLWKKKEIDCIKGTCSDQSPDEVWWVPIDDTETLTLHTIRVMENMHYNHFKGFKNKAFKACKVTIRRPVEDYDLIALGTCRDFFKNLKCIHSLGVSMRLNLIHIPTRVKKAAKKKYEENIQLPGGRRKPGRTSNATPALMRQ